MTLLHFEFVKRRRIPWLAILVLAAALAWGAVTLHRWNNLRVRIAAKEAEIAALERETTSLRNAAAQAKLSRDPAQQQRDAAERKAQIALSYPWAAVFSAVELADDPNVAVLLFAHDQASGKTHLSVEALDVPTLTAYVGRLNDGDQARRWYIASYRMQTQAVPNTVLAEILQK